jgi:membrane fusion protein, multidrug efflux system
VFFSSTESNVLSVPLASVSAAGKNAYVWVVNADNSIRKVPVSVGEYGRDSVTIRSGLQPKDYVVVGGVHLLREKQKIQPISRDNKTVKIAIGS